MHNSPTLSSPIVIVSESTGSLLVFSSLTVPFMLAKGIQLHLLSKTKRELQPCYFPSSTSIIIITFLGRRLGLGLGLGYKGALKQQTRSQIEID